MPWIYKCVPLFLIPASTAKEATLHVHIVCVTAQSKYAVLAYPENRNSQCCLAAIWHARLLDTKLSGVLRHSGNRDGALCKDAFLLHLSLALSTFFSKTLRQLSLSCSYCGFWNFWWNACVASLSGEMLEGKDCDESFQKYVCTYVDQMLLTTLRSSQRPSESKASYIWV